MDKKFYGLILQKKSQKLEQKSKSIFDSSDDESESPSRSTKITEFSKTSSKLQSKNISLQKKLVKDDPTIYEYDSIYDSMKEKQTDKQVVSKKEGSKYISNLMKAAEKRKKEQDRRQERKIQTEREKEGDEFRDKEAFVTSTYKNKMLELQEEENREKLQDQIDDMMDVTKQKDLSGFYRHYLKQTVGEEAIPDFGDRELKIKELSERIKQESLEKNVKSEENTIKNINISTADPQKFDDLDADSYGSSNESDDGDKIMKKKKDSYSESSDKDDENEYKIKKSLIDIPKTKAKNKKSSKSNESTDDDDETKEKLAKTHKIDSKYHHDSSSETDDSKSDKQVTSKRKLSSDRQTSKKTRQEKNSDLTSEESINVSKLCEQINLSDDRDDGTVDKNQNVPKVKTDMRLKFVKRTIGEVFDGAQARYFKRMASRKLN